MSKNTKIVIAIIAGIVIICCLGAAIAATILPGIFEDFADNTIIEDTGEAAEVASSMVDYTLPPGYREEGGMSLLGLKTVFIASENQFDSVIIIMQFPSGISGDEEQMQEQIEDAFRQQSGSQNLELTFIGSETKTINDAPATLATYEGVDDSGNEIRQIIIVFETKDGNTGMMMLIGSKANWENSGIESFLASLR